MTSPPSSEGAGPGDRHRLSRRAIIDGAVERPLWKDRPSWVLVAEDDP
jgi:hypothetical protein